MEEMHNKEQEKVFDIKTKKGREITSLFMSGSGEGHPGAVLVYLILGIGLIAFYTASVNPGIFSLHEETLALITDTYNLIILLLVPMFFGSLGAISRVMLSGISIGDNKRLVFSSGLIAAFSWLGIKSKVFLALVSPSMGVVQAGAEGDTAALIQHTGNEIYSMVLVSVLVGMFASNIYILINQRAEQLSRKPISSARPKEES